MIKPDLPNECDCFPVKVGRTVLAFLCISWIKGTDKENKNTLNFTPS